jgi:hypothetical protein
MIKLDDMGMNPYMGALAERIAALRGQPVDPGQTDPRQWTSPPVVVPPGTRVGPGFELGAATGLGRGLGLGYGYGNPYNGLFPRFRSLWGGTPTVPSPVQLPQRTAYGWGGSTL